MRLTTEIKKRYDNGYQTTILCCGDMNEGKTKFMLFIFFLIEKIILKKKEITIEPYFSVLDFAIKISKIKNESIFFDEVGAGGLDVRAWNSQDNKLLSHILQTQRIKRNFYYIILPHKRLMTHTHLILFDYYIIIKYNLEKQERIAHIYKINTRHMATNDFDDYIQFSFMEKIIIPDYMNNPQLKELKNFMIKYEYKEHEKKQDIACKIEKEAQELLLKNTIVKKLNRSLKHY